MEVKNEYRKAFYEVLMYLKNTNEELIEKIPEVFIEFLKYYSYPSYSVCCGSQKEITLNDLSRKAKDILNVLYVNWWSTESDKKRYSNKILEYGKRINI